MAWRYNSRTGVMTNDQDSAMSFLGYAGHGEGLNNPDMEFVPNVGPLPRVPSGYEIGEPEDSPHTGPFSLRLTPRSPDELQGRDEFLIHGDSQSMDHTASNGCIILARAAREAIHASGDTSLEVWA